MLMEWLTEREKAKRPQSHRALSLEALPTMDLEFYSSRDVASEASASTRAPRHGGHGIQCLEQPPNESSGLDMALFSLELWTNHRVIFKWKVETFLLPRGQEDVRRGHGKHTVGLFTLSQGNGKKWQARWTKGSSRLSTSALSISQAFESHYNFRKQMSF